MPKIKGCTPVSLSGLSWFSSAGLLADTDFIALSARLLLPGLAPGSNLSELELNPMMGVLKDTGGQQSRFKWMMEGHSPAPSPPDTTLHKNGKLTDGLSNSYLFIYFLPYFILFLSGRTSTRLSTICSKHIGIHLFFFYVIFF